MSCIEDCASEPTTKADLEQIPSLNDTSCGYSTEKEEGGKEASQDFDPLFMDCLPSDFSTNPKLSALASLLDDEEYREENGKNTKKRRDDTPATVIPIAGGGKVRRRNRGNSKATTPYWMPQKDVETRHTSIGEAQLFLKMWKL